ncbi:Glycine receptor subunit alpha-3 like protein [Argiope bruennichi]|uniref:Glycine receptor subunit alpha-3 like protein n=1 Tax=Argiope bruennichi TaxID=94029 RepID=A0A8T0F8B5_ARGBR|nr:Glycine receptor subunit alpha-3 like protein [Argiope bruennichi]
MKFEDYPFDVQRCIFSVGLMTTTDAEAEIKWFSDKTCPYMEAPLEMLRKIEPLQFYLGEPTLHSITKEYFQGGSENEVEKDRFTYLLVNFTFVRRIVSSIINIYVPSALIVAMSWATFWMRLDSIPARVALSVTSLLTLCTQVQQYKRNLPPVSYVTAMDIWLFVCIFMVFSTLVEFAVCFNIFAQSQDQLKKNSLQLADPDLKLKKAAWPEISDQTTSLTDEKVKQKKTDNKEFCDPILIDSYCKFIFPGLFILFAIIYWSYNLTAYINNIAVLLHENGELEEI